MQHIKKITLILTTVITIVLLCRCCSPQYNIKWTGTPTVVDTTHYPVPNDSQTIVFVCFSGGGTRAMAMGYHVVENLIQVRYRPNVRQADTLWSTLRDEIDFTSGVSGGSFVSAALGVYPPKCWSDFYRSGVSCNIQKQIILNMLLPWNILRILSPYYTRTDIAAQYYTTHIFKNKMFGQLFDRPVVYINATLLAEGAHFVYTDQYFQYINSDRSCYPLGMACAASSAFPGGFAPMTVRNFNTEVVPESTMLKDPRFTNAVRNSATDIYQYEFAKMYRFLHDSTNEWVHLSDGGIAGNTGIERILDEWKTNGVINKALNNDNPPLKRIILIVVNAEAISVDKSCVKQKPPTIPKVILYTTTTAMNILSRERYAVLQERADDLWQTVQELRTVDPALAQLEKPYLIEINARNIKDQQLRTQFNKIPTTFDLPTGQLETIHKAVDDLMNNNAEFIRLKQSLAAEQK